MFKISFGIAALVALVVGFPLNAAAQQATGQLVNNSNFVSPNTSSQASTQSTSGATNAGNAQSINFNSKNDGTSTVKSAPPLGGQGFYGSFSSDSCMVSGGGGVSVIGLGGQLVTPVEDKNCSLRRNAERIMQISATTKDAARSQRLETAAIDVLCRAGAETAAALSGQGLCADGAPAPMQPSAAIRQDWESFYTPG